MENILDQKLRAVTDIMAKTVNDKIMETLNKILHPLGDPQASTSGQSHSVSQESPQQQKAKTNYFAGTSGISPSKSSQKEHSNKGMMDSLNQIEIEAQNINDFDS